MDRISRSRRSAIMSRIRGRGNERTELTVARFFRRAGIKGWRRHMTVKLVSSIGFASDGTKFKSLVRPDFTFPKKRLAVFIDGCFWHGCPRCYRSPKTHKRFWWAKVARNRERDYFQSVALRKSRWRVIRVWECRLRRGLSTQSTIIKLLQWLRRRGL